MRIACSVRRGPGAQARARQGHRAAPHHAVAAAQDAPAVGRRRLPTRLRRGRPSSVPDEFWYVSSFRFGLCGQFQRHFGHVSCGFSRRLSMVLARRLRTHSQTPNGESSTAGATRGRATARRRPEATRAAPEISDPLIRESAPLSIRQDAELGRVRRRRVAALRLQLASSSHMAPAGVHRDSSDVRLVPRIYTVRFQSPSWTLSRVPTYSRQVCVGSLEHPSSPKASRLVEDALSNTNALPNRWAQAPARRAGMLLQLTSLECPSPRPLRLVSPW